jgi:hypothetical protein
MSAMFAGVAFTVVFSIPALVREIRLARRYESPGNPVVAQANVYGSGTPGPNFYGAFDR